MDRVERAGSVSSTPITSPTVLSTNNQRGLTATQQAAACEQPLPHRVNFGVTGAHGLSTMPPLLTVSSDTKDAVVPSTEVLRSIPSISSAVSQLLATYDHQADKEAM